MLQDQLEYCRTQVKELKREKRTIEMEFVRCKSKNEQLEEVVKILGGQSRCSQQ